MTSRLNEDSNSAYWNEFYGKHTAPLVPSQFAAFVMGQFSQLGFVIDIGCGNGRDTAFFLNFKVPVLAIDRSQVALDELLHKHFDARFGAICGDITDDVLPAKVENWLSCLGPNVPGIVYARFFLHAIDDEQEEAFLRLISDLARKRDIVLCLEFRTIEDARRTKVTGVHFRRYVDPAAFISRAQGFGLHTTYFIEGCGYAVFGSDDAHVARIFLSSRVP